MALFLVTDADAALGAETLRPVTSQVNVRLGDIAVADEQPKTKNGLGEDVQHKVDDDLGVDIRLAGKRCDAPDTERY